MNTRFVARVGAASIALGLGLSLVLTGCSGAPMMATKDSAVLTGEAPVAGDVTAGNAGSNDANAVNPDGTNATVQRSTIETAYLQITASNPKDAVAKATELATGAGGFVQDSSWSPANEYSAESAFLTIRVPAQNIDRVLPDLEALGTVDSLSRAQTDVTLQMTDLTSRIASLQASLESLRALQAQATNVSDLITVESAITQRQAELDSLVAQQTYLADQVDMSTISLSVYGTAGGTPTNQTFWDGLIAGWNSLGVAGSALLVAVGFSLPWLVLLIVVGGAIVWLVLALVRRSRSKNVSVSAGATSTGAKSTESKSTGSKSTGSTKK